MNTDSELRFFNFKNKIARHSLATMIVNKLRAIYFHLKYYKGNAKSKYDGVVLLVDKRRKAGGLGDRIFGMLCHFALCKTVGLNYKIHHVSPFDLSVFLVPNNYDWKIEVQDVVYSKRTKVYMCGVFNTPFISKYRKLAKKHGQKHIYSALNCLNKVNEYYGTNYTFHELYEELFKPSDLLASDLAEVRKNLPEKYISICFRHSNLFGDFKEYNYTESYDDVKEYVVNICRKGIEEKIAECGLPAVVTSDSVAFLSRLQGMKDVYIFNKNKNISHMDTVSNDSLKSYEQSFLDLYVLGGGGEDIQFTA